MADGCNSTAEYSGVEINFLRTCGDERQSGGGLCNPQPSQYSELVVRHDDPNALRLSRARCTRESRPVPPTSPPFPPTPT